MTRVLAVDWGTRRVGLAVSDSGALARSLAPLTVRSRADAVGKIRRVAADEAVDTIVVGLPLDMDDGEGASAKQARKLGRALEREGFRVVFQDERLTSERARELLAERGETRPAPGRVDAVAAAVLLQDFLDANP